MDVQILIGLLLNETAFGSQTASLPERLRLLGCFATRTASPTRLLRYQTDFVVNIFLNLDMGGWK